MALALYEFLLWCEDMNAEPLLGLYAGYSLKGVHVNPGTGPRAVRPGCARRDRVRDRAGHVEMGSAASEGRPPATLQADLRRGRERRLVRQVVLYDQRFVAVQQSHQARYPQLKVISTGRVRAA
jgi:alpha-N-arabinofuranosidase